MSTLSEADIEVILLEQFLKLGYVRLPDSVIGPGINEFSK